MPNIITHKLFAQKVFQNCDKQDIKNMIEKHLQLFYIGSNGPDFLFFYHMQPKEMMKEHSLNHIGSALHAGNVNAFYERTRSVYQGKRACIPVRTSLSLGVGYECASVYILSHRS